MRDCFGRNIHYLRVSVTELCNLRCRYCMPEAGVYKRDHAEMMSEDETVLAIETAAELGFDKLRITGGEPLVKKNILTLCRRAGNVKGIRELCLTTNATGLDRLAGPLLDAGVSRINISLDTLDAKKYMYMSRRDEFAAAMRGLDAALAAGFEKIKINCVLIGGFNDDEIPALAELSRSTGADVRFIELMPMCAGDFDKAAYIPADTVLERLPELCQEPADGGVARLFRLPGAKGRIGLISPVSAHFCAMCNRLRLTADGRLKPCLHRADEYRIKGLDRDGMRRVFLEAIAHKPAQRGALSYDEKSRAGRDMNRIGG